jgi:cell division septum initiation protein DivIVA
MNPDLVNIYIERLLHEVGELTKTRILLDTQLKYTEMLNANLQRQLAEAQTQIEKLNKKKSKEVNTSDTF